MQADSCESHANLETDGDRPLGAVRGCGFFRDPQHPFRISALGPKTENADSFIEHLDETAAAIRSFAAHNVDLIVVNQMEMPLPRDLDSTVLPVVSFNLGVELGQIAILLVAFPILAWIRKGATEEESAKRQMKLVRIGSAPILLLGCFWLVDRVFQKGWMPF